MNDAEAHPPRAADDAITLQFTLTEDEVIAAFERVLHARRTLLYTVHRVFFFAVAMGFLAFGIFELVRGYVIPGIVLIAAAMFALLLMARPLQRQSRRIVRRMKQSELFDEQQVTIDEDGVSQQTERSSHAMSWNGFADLSRDDRMAYLEMSDNLALMIPLRALPADLSAEQFMARCEQWWERAVPSDDDDYDDDDDTGADEDLYPEDADDAAVGRR